MERLARNSLPGPGEDQDDEVEDGEEHITEQLRRLYRQPLPPATRIMGSVSIRAALPVPRCLLACCLCQGFPNARGIAGRLF